MSPRHTKHGVLKRRIAVQWLRKPSETPRNPWKPTGNPVETQRKPGPQTARKLHETLKTQPTLAKNTSRKCLCSSQSLVRITNHVEHLSRNIVPEPVQPPNDTSQLQGQGRGGGRPPARTTRPPAQQPHRPAAHAAGRPAAASPDKDARGSAGYGTSWFPTSHMCMCMCIHTYICVCVEKYL